MDPSRQNVGGSVMGKPYLSLVVVARNDNYGGDFRGRINVFVHVLFDLCEDHGLPSELLIVDWNPPPNAAALRKAISWPKPRAGFLQVKIVRVPGDVHSRLSNPNRMKLFEYLGKNVGALRASGDYIMATNPDVVFSDELIAFLSQRRLKKSEFYRINRHDVRSPVPLEFDTGKQLEYCSKNVLRMCSQFGTTELPISLGSKVVNRLRTLKRSILAHKEVFPYRPLHTNASGDFFLTHRDNWHWMRGYPELESKGKSHQIDGLILYQALFGGLNQRILRDPLRLYHQDHGRPDSGKDPSEAVASAYASLINARANIQFNSSDWGLGQESLPEELIYD